MTQLVTSGDKKTAPDSTSEFREKLAPLTSLRFFAAAAIVVYHLNADGVFGLSPKVTAPFLLWQGVSFFFILSGFILTHVYPSLQTTGNKRFLLARFARIWPAHFAALLVLFLLLPAEIRNEMSQDANYSFGTILLNLSMLHAWIPLIQSYFTFNAVSWSISTEFGFYFCFLLLIRNWEHTWWYKLAATLLLATIMITLANTGQFASQKFVIPGLVQMNPAARLFEFALGMTTALLWKFIRNKFEPKLWAGTLFEILAIGLLIFSMYNTLAWSQQLLSWFSWLGPAGLLWLQQGAICAPSFMLVIFIMSWGKGYISRFLSPPLLVFLGEISFSVYLFHQILLRFYKLNIISFIDVPSWLGYAYFWALTLTTAYVVWSVVERPSQRFILRLWPRSSNYRPERLDKPPDRSKPVQAKGSLRRPTLIRKTGGVALLCLLLLPVIYQIQASKILPSMNALYKNNTQTSYAIELLGEAYNSAGPVTLTRHNFTEGTFPITGYAIDGPANNIARGVYIFIDDKDQLTANYGLERPDLAQYLGSNQYLYSGFQGKVPLDKLSTGTHYLTIRIVAKDEVSFYESRKIDFQII